MKVSKILLCVLVSIVSAVFAQAGDNESMKAASGERFLESPHAGQVRGTAVTALLSNRKEPVLAAFGVKLVSDQRSVPVPATHRRTNIPLGGAFIRGAIVGIILGVSSGLALNPALFPGNVVFGALGGGIISVGIELWQRTS
jgi:hypothetical protein